MTATVNRGNNTFLIELLSNFINNLHKEKTKTQLSYDPKRNNTISIPS